MPIGSSSQLAGLKTDTITDASGCKSGSGQVVPQAPPGGGAYHRTGESEGVWQKKGIHAAFSSVIITCGGCRGYPVGGKENSIWRPSGKKARCRACGAVFTVPAPDYDPDAQPIPLEGSDAPAPQTPAEEPETGGWLADFAREEKRTGDDKPVMMIDFARKPLSEEDPEKAAQERARTAIPRITGRLPHEEAGVHDAERSGVVGPERPFWQDLLQSFLFLAEPSSLVTYLILAVAAFVAYFVPLASLFFTLVVNLYIAAFYMAVVRDTAAGDDRLPETVWMTGVFDLVWPLVHFLGVTALAMLPATIYVLSNAGGHAGMDFIWYVIRAPQIPAVQGLTVLGLFFWPVMILAVAIGGSFRGLWPHVVVRTALCAPLPYLAMCAMVLIAATLWYLPYSSQVASLSEKLSQQFGNRVIATQRLLGDLISLYAGIVAMRSIGLFYRHYKHKFPWVAE
jgi:hypothetical protein